MFLSPLTGWVSFKNAQLAKSFLAPNSAQLSTALRIKSRLLSMVCEALGPSLLYTETMALAALITFLPLTLVNLPLFLLDFISSKEP